MNNLKALIDQYLKNHPDWQEHPQYEGTHLHWEDLKANPNTDRTRLSTDLASTRQMAREGMATRDYGNPAE